MSNAGQAALIVVGTVVGTYFGYPQLGFVLGSLAGSVLFPTQLPPGPKISDNRTTTSTVGSPVAIVFGTANVAGSVIWLGPNVQSTEEQGGSGGPQQQTFSYNQSIAIGLCERVDDTADDAIGAISGISRIWENGSIVYDIRPQLAANSDEGSIAETDEQYQSRLQQSAAYAETFTLYLGDELQEADPTIEAIQGVGATPPFRGLAYIVYPNRALQIAQGLRHPNFQFEVFQFGTGACTEATEYSNDVLYPWFDTGNIYTYKIENLPLGVGTSPIHNIYNSVDAAIAAAFAYTDVNQDVKIGYGVPPEASAADVTLVPLSGSVDIGSSTAGVIVDPTVVYLHYSFVFPTDGLKEPQAAPNLDPSSLLGIAGSVFWQHSVIALGLGGAGVTHTTTVPSSDPTFVLDYPYQTFTGFSGFPWYEGIRDLFLGVTRSPGAPIDPCTGLVPSVNLPGYAVNLEGQLVKCNTWTKDISTTYKVLQIFAANQASAPNENYLTKHPLNPCLPITDPNYDNATFWEAAYATAVTDGLIAGGLTYGTDYPKTQAFGYVLDSVVCEGQGEGVSIAEVITAICKRSGLMAVDTSDLDAISIDGYAINSVCSGSSIITPLRSIGFFDAVETDGVIKFLARGKPIVATLTTDDFGCYDQSQGIDGQDNVDSTGASNCPPSITVTRSQDEDLPRSIRFHYIATARDYEDGEQDSPFRLATIATNDVDVSVPVCLGDVQAAKCASVLWADSWAARSAYEISVDQSFLNLDVGDAIAVPVDGFEQRCRIVSDTNASACLRKLSLVRDDAAAFISYAVATIPQRLPQRLTFIGASSFELLDLPCLRDQDSDPGFYVAAQQQIVSGVSGSWSGMVLYKSNDGGMTFTQYLALTSEATIGAIASAVPKSQAFTWDDETVITVNVRATFGFESTTDDAMLAGANVAAMGADGRWEIVQWGLATQLSSTQWELSHLLRGRRGTEHVLGSSQIGDTFVVVSTGDLGRVILETTEIGAARVYKGVSIGASYSSGTDQPFTGHAEALVCFSPVDAIAQRETDGDIRISWIRRSRLGRTLMSGVDIPLGETTEAFSIDILEAHSPASPEIVLRTLTSSTESVLYSHANQETDFGSPLPSIIKVAIYQLSAIVGRGTPLIATLTVAGV